MKKIIFYFRFIPIMTFAFLFTKNERLIMDVDRWTKNKVEGSFIYKCAYLMMNYKEFRNLFIFRNNSHKIFRRWIAIWYPPISTLYIECNDIGGGFFIQHGFSTFVTAQKIGKNFSLNQQVTIGYNGNTKPPIIGDNVMVTCGAKVLGDIVIGDNTRIGANAVVLKDYKRGHGVLVGVPAVPKKEATKEQLIELGIDIDESLFE